MRKRARVWGIAGSVHLHVAIWLSRVHTLFHFAELVVAESVVVIKKLLQMQPAQHGEIIKHLAKLTDNIQVWMAVMPRPLPCSPLRPSLIPRPYN